MLSIGLGLGINKQQPRAVPTSLSLVLTVDASAVLGVNGGPLWLAQRDGGIFVSNSVGQWRQMSIAGAALGASAGQFLWNGGAPDNPLEWFHEIFGGVFDGDTDHFHAFNDQGNYYRFKPGDTLATDKKNIVTSARSITVKFGDELFGFNGGDGSTFSNVVSRFSPALPSVTALSENTSARVQLPQSFVGQELYAGGVSVLDGRWCTCSGSGDPPNLMILTVPGTTGTTVDLPLTGAPSDGVESMIVAYGFVWITVADGNIYKFSINY